MRESLKTVCVVGASGAIGRACVAHYAKRGDCQIIATARDPSEISDLRNVHATIHLDLQDEHSMQALCAFLQSRVKHCDELVVATGMLHDDLYQPEKTIAQCSLPHMQRSFTINAAGPILLLKHMLPIICPQRLAKVMFLSARLSSISDNRLGGWYSYRAGKCALNMLIKSVSIEWQRTHPKALVVGMHPGTVDSRLSQPFQRRLRPGQLKTADQAAAEMLTWLAAANSTHSGRCWAYDGTEIIP
jgi:NAD(P)-dependent dehydrogenase (short-subunit alcohol dehydrogenase family)